MYLSQQRRTRYSDFTNDVLYVFKFFKFKRTCGYRPPPTMSCTQNELVGLCCLSRKKGQGGDPSNTFIRVKCTFSSNKSQEK